MIFTGLITECLQIDYRLITDSLQYLFTGSYPVYYVFHQTLLITEFVFRRAREKCKLG